VLVKYEILCIKYLLQYCLRTESCRVQTWWKFSRDIFEIER